MRGRREEAEQKIWRVEEKRSRRRKAKTEEMEGRMKTKREVKRLKRVGDME